MQRKIFGAKVDKKYSKNMEKSRWKNSHSSRFTTITAIIPEQMGVTEKSPHNYLCGDFFTTV